MGFKQYTTLAYTFQLCSNSRQKHEAAECIDINNISKMYIEREEKKQLAA